VVIYVNAPTAISPWVGRMGLQGAQLAADQINNRTGVVVAGKSYRIKIRTEDNHGDAGQALATIRTAVAEKAVAVIDDGSTVSATADTARQAGLPLLVYFDGTSGIVDPAARPNVFRLAPSNQALAERLGGYLAGKGLRLALVHDDTDYGVDGAVQFRQALAAAGTAAVADLTAPAGLPDYRDQAARAIAASGTAVVIWATAPVVAGVLKSLREQGSTLPVYTGPTGEDPSVRTTLASRPDWVQGLTFASLRITDAPGLASWQKFRAGYETLYGEDRLGLGESIRRSVVQPPDWQMLSYDMVYLVKAALEKAGTTDTSNGKLVAALNSVQAQGANGAPVGWTATNHEGIGRDQIYFAVILNLNFQPVQDDPISKAQPQIEQD
jgi:ABC-type branched-subunit amino acid transport system substrate-binding protein